MTALVQYYAKVGISIDTLQLQKVDRYLRLLETKLSRFQTKQLTSGIKLQVNERDLVVKVGNALDRASDKVTLELKNFHINPQALSAALRRVSASAAVGLSGGNVRQTTQVGRSASSYERANFLHAGGGAGAIARYGLSSLPFIGGVYGVGQLNQANQNMMSANIAAESVLGVNAKPMMDWLSQRANYLGVNYAETLPQFTKFMASASPLLGAESSRDVFSSFMQFGRTRGATGVSMNRALNAVAQMGAKGQIMQEELKSQLAEASGFGELPQLFAEAYQIQTGGSLQGAEARAALMKAMEDGLVKSDILPLVSKLMDELSKGGIERARTSSIAEQERAMNALTGRNGLLQTFSQAGGEQGFAKFWKEAARIFREMRPLVEGLGGAFNDLSRIMQPVAAVFEGWNRILETTSELTGISKTRLLEFAALGGLMMTKWGRVATMFTGILLVMEDFSFGMAGKDSYTKDFIDFMNSEGLSAGQAKFAAIAAALTAVATAMALISRNSALPGVGDILGRRGGTQTTPNSNNRGAPWGKLGTGLAAGGLGAGAYYLGTEGIPNTNFFGKTGADLLSNSALGLWLGGPMGAAAGGIWSLANPTWGESNLPYDPSGYRMVPPQNNDDLVVAMMQSRLRNNAGGVNPTPSQTNVEIKVEANITAQDAQGFSQNLKLEIDKALGNYNLSQ